MSRVLIDDVKAAVCAEYGITEAELTGPRLHRRVSFPRQVAMTLAVEMTESSTTVIGKLFGGRDHTTVLCAQRRFKAKNPPRGMQCELPRIRQRIADEVAERRARNGLPIEEGLWLGMADAPLDGSVISVAVRKYSNKPGPSLQELPYPVKFAEGAWRYARNMARVFPWHRPIRWRMPTERFVRAKMEGAGE